MKGKSYLLIRLGRCWHFRIDDADVEDEEDEDDAKDGNSGSSTTGTTSNVTTGTSPVTGNDEIVRMMIMILMIGCAVAVSSAKKIKEYTK